MNCLLKIILFPILLTGVLACKSNNPANKETLQAPQGWELVWSDEFNYAGLPDSASWNYDVGGHGWGNNERQFYTAKRVENARVENGILVLEARKEKMDTNGFTSARLVTKARHEWLYGRFEIRAKLPKGTGTWPAIWMLAADKNYGESYWPDNGEIDIMEHVGFHQGFIHASTHSRKYFWQIGTQRTDTIFSTDCSGTFHNYILEWYPDSIHIFMDDSLYFTSVNDHTGWEAWPFDKPFYLILNIAVGGSWGGQKGIDDTIWPQKMEVDYVRVYRLLVK
jgi:beta-glucanase (GH16 family)